jgi:hypothetical protein
VSFLGLRVGRWNGAQITPGRLTRVRWFFLVLWHRAEYFQQQQNLCPGPAHPRGSTGDLSWCYDFLYKPHLRAERLTAATLTSTLTSAIAIPFVAAAILWHWFGARGQIGAQHSSQARPNEEL